MGEVVVLETGNQDNRWVVCQLGARMHYAVPRLLHEANKLARFYTDIYAGRAGPRLLAALPERWRLSGIRRLLSRVAIGLPDELVESYPIFGFLYYARSAAAKNPEILSAVYLWAGKWFGERVVRDGFGEAVAVYTFNTAALEILRAARERGMFTVVEQTIAPRGMEEDLLASEHARYPDWEPPRLNGGAAERTRQREHQEWALADLIVCGSEFVRDGIAHCGGPVERCVVVPYGVDSHFSPVVRERKRGPLRVLTVGQVCLRKGAAYAMEVAQALQGIAELRWVGPVRLLDAAKAELARHLELTGTVARSHIMKHYEWADVFFLPSVCEGSATVTYEALACGLPVVTTPNAGSPVRDGVDGFVVPAHASATMTARLRQLHHDRPLLARLAEAAVRRSQDVSLSSYQRRLLQVLSAGGAHGLSDQRSYQ
jgi:glycosyltransferase involved in cell wall biosynthesis